MMFTRHMGITAVFLLCVAFGWAGVNMFFPTSLAFTRTALERLNAHAEDMSSVLAILPSSFTKTTLDPQVRTDFIEQGKETTSRFSFEDARALDYAYPALGTRYYEDAVGGLSAFVSGVEEWDEEKIDAGRAGFARWNEWYGQHASQLITP